MNHLFAVFLQNGYPQVLVSDILFQPITSNVISTSNIDSGLDTREEFTVGSLVLPYMREINGPIKALCKQLNINFLNRKKTNLGALIAHKRPCNDILGVKQSENLEREQRSVLLFAKRPFFLKQFIRA